MIRQSLRRVVPVLLLILGLIWIPVSASSPDQSANDQSAPAAGFFAPDFTLSSLDGQTYTLSELRGHPILLDLWASWCPPCRAEMPAIQRIYEEYQSQGFLVLAVNATSQDDPASARAFAESLGLTYPILLDETGDVAHLYGLRALPTTFFIDADGRIADVVIGGPLSQALLSIQVENLIASAP